MMFFSFFFSFFLYNDIYFRSTYNEFDFMVNIRKVCAGSKLIRYHHHLFSLFFEQNNPIETWNHSISHRYTVIIYCNESELISYLGVKLAVTCQPGNICPHFRSLNLFLLIF